MKKKQKQKKNDKTASMLAHQWSSDIENFDVLGSWTGTPKDEDEKPQQDADDL